ncbi:MAG: response regulator [Caldimonas sp.]
MATAQKAKPGRILVIEDDPDILEVLKLMLEYEGHQVVIAKDGRAALAAAASRPFDVVVMDISMPEMSGIDVAAALRGDPKTADVYIAIHTGLDERWVRERFADYDAFLTKADDADILVGEIARLLAQPRTPRGQRAAAAAEATFSGQDVARARDALRQEMGLGAQALPLDAFVATLREELDQLARMGRTGEEIAALLGATLERPVVAAALARPEKP